MWEMSGGTCAALHTLPAELNVNQEFSHALVVGQELHWATPLPLLCHLLLQKLSINPWPLRNGATAAATGLGNVAVQSYLIRGLRTRMPKPTRRRNLGKFCDSTRRRRRTSTYRTVSKCGRILHQWSTQWMVLQDVRPGMRRRSSPPTWRATEIVSFCRWCTM